MNAPLVIGVIGDRHPDRIAGDLADVGARVRAVPDPPLCGLPEGVERAGGYREAIEGADVVLSVGSDRRGQSALSLAERVASSLREDQLYADFSTATRQVMRRVARRVAHEGALFADAARVPIVPGAGIRTPVLVSGPGAERFAELFRPLRMPVTDVEAEAGAATARRLVRCVFTRGVAAAIEEAGEAARALNWGLKGDEGLDCEEWLEHEMERILAEADRGFLYRDESAPWKAGRHHEEMVAAEKLLSQLGVKPRVTRAARDWLASNAPGIEDPGARRERKRGRRSAR